MAWPKARPPTRVFRYWAGEDTDASVVVDDEGMLYVGVEYEKGRSRAQEVGQLDQARSEPSPTTRWCGRSTTGS